MFPDNFELILNIVTCISPLLIFWYFNDKNVDKSILRNSDHHFASYHLHQHESSTGYYILSKLCLQNPFPGSVRSNRKMETIIYKVYIILISNKIVLSF